MLKKEKPARVRIVKRRSGCVNHIIKQNIIYINISNSLVKKVAIWRFFAGNAIYLENTCMAYNYLGFILSKVSLSKNSLPANPENSISAPDKLREEGTRLRPFLPVRVRTQTGLSVIVSFKLAIPFKSS